jgi:hypothetical protein
MSTQTDDELLASDDLDWVERQFFSQASLRHHDLDWGPIAPMPNGARRAMHASLGMVVVAVVGLIVFAVYANLIMPAPAPIGTELPVLPPSAANATSPDRPNG